MALSDVEKQRILFLSGIAGKALIESSTHYNSVIASRLTNLSSEIELIVRQSLSRLAAIDTKIEQAACRLSASQVDSIRTNPEELYQLRKERLKQIKELCAMLDIPVMRPGGVMVDVCV